jgi:uncharacterized cupredoxin-like copper-binding protein
MRTAGRRAGGVLLVLSLAAATSSCTDRPRTIEVTIRDSRFSPAALSASVGDHLRFILVNTDPIAHEFIVGTHAQQLRHENGTDATHDGAPGAASLAIGETQTVEFIATTAGALEFACHLPGHYDYGMRGTLTVR